MVELRAAEVVGKLQALGLEEEASAITRERLDWMRGLADLRAQLSEAVEQLGGVKAERDLFRNAVADIIDHVGQCVDVDDGVEGPKPNWAMRWMTNHGDRCAELLK